MVSFRRLATLAIGMSSMLDPACAHPGEHLTNLQIKREAETAQALAARAATKLARCANTVKARAVRERAAKRRAAKAAALKQKRALKRDSSQTESYDATSHNYTGIIDQDEAFTVNTSCILQPQATIGPYWVEGELIRQDLTDGQDGVSMQLELEFINVNTCEPVSNLYVDLWHANATGYYSGIEESGLDTTFLRGIQITDDDGVATFDTLVAGHYAGRAVHSHLMVHQDVTVYDNGTYTGGTVRSISQLFYESTLQSYVEAVEPYASNSNSITSNTADSILNAITDDSYDPFLKYIYLGSSVSDGIFAFHSIGIDLDADYTSNESAAAHYYESGGVANSNSGMGGGAGGPPSGSGGGNGTGGPGGAAPSGMSGAIPSGTVSGTARASGTNIVGSASANSASTTVTATSNSGARGSRGGFFRSIGIFSKAGQRPSGLPTNLPVGDGQRSGAPGQRVSDGASGAAPTDAPSAVAPEQNTRVAAQTSFSNCS